MHSLQSMNQPARFFFNGLTTEDCLVAADVEAYSIEHPHTHVMMLLVEDMGVPE